MNDRGTSDEDGGQSPISVLIVDDHAVLRAGLRMLLDAESDMEVVGEAGDGAEALARAVELTPDIVLLDVTMPGMSGLDVLRRVQEVSPPTRVLILTMHDDQGYVRQALEGGGLGYVLKRAADIELLSAIRAVYGGGTYLHAAHTRALVESTANQPRTEASGEPEHPLSSREGEVLRLVALGYTNRHAAKMLDLSVKTVEAYRARMMSKLGLHNRVELVRYALQHGLVEEA